MLHSGVFVGRQYCTFAGITHGQKVHDFVEKLLAKRLATATPIGQRARVFHVHHKPLYAAIGERDNRHRKRPTMRRAIERLMILDGVLAGPAVTWLGTEREKWRYFIERLGTRLDNHEYPRLVFGTPPTSAPLKRVERTLDTLGADPNQQPIYPAMDTGIDRSCYERASGQEVASCSAFRESPAQRRDI